MKILHVFPNIKNNTRIIKNCEEDQVSFIFLFLFLSILKFLYIGIDSIAIEDCEHCLCLHLNLFDKVNFLGGVTN